MSLLHSVPVESSQDRSITIEGKYLTFMLQKEIYGVKILKVKEIIGLLPITFLPQMPKYVRGVINLRGKVIPVMDLRSRFGMPEKDYSERTCIIVVEVSHDDSPVLMGIVVDEVSEVLSITGPDIAETPSFGVQLDTEFILGMAKMDSAVKILLDIDRVIGSDCTLN